MIYIDVVDKLLNTAKEYVNLSDAYKEKGILYEAMLNNKIAKILVDIAEEINEELRSKIDNMYN